ncbi:hypothetical protein [Gracilibacillus sp. YIM 98692]|uniref:hypothetical protein n=1 Tax=Gracilibacillus sp. YIM 98692 TaxID=2663532 RepID=UPI0013D7937E|nr:hypothetical protein [Gracilibacillus sp. YIM 98692]
MARKEPNKIQRGQAITFRLPSDTPDHIIKQLQKLKETERRNFSSKIAEFALEGVSQSFSKERETLTIPMPRQLTKEQRNWLKHSHSEAMLGSIVYQLLADPMRATSVLASLNSDAVDIDEALHLQEQASASIEQEENPVDEQIESTVQVEEEAPPLSNSDDDLMNFDFKKAREEVAQMAEEKEDDEDEAPEDLLGDFLAQMNK